LIPHLEALAGTGIDCIELFCTDATDAQWREPGFPARLVAAAGRLGLRLPSCHAPFGATDLSSVDEAVRRASVETVTEVFALARDLGAGIVVVHAGTEPPEEADRGLLTNQALKSLDTLAPRADVRGVRIALEMLPRTCIPNRVAEMLHMLETLGGRIGVCYDINHAGLYEDVPWSVTTLGSHLITTHISDHDGQERHWLPGRGMVDWPAFIRALDKIGYDGPLMHEAFLPDGNLEGTFAQIAGFWRELQG